jgi:hypothetical protein
MRKKMMNHLVVAHQLVELLRKTKRKKFLVRSLVLLKMMRTMSHHAKQLVAWKRMKTQTVSTT